ncbi:MAG: hypothetical protein QM803_16300 [Rhodocyclaceae bacterium]
MTRGFMPSQLCVGPATVFDARENWRSAVASLYAPKDVVVRMRGALASAIGMTSDTAWSSFVLAVRSG